MKRESRGFTLLEVMVALTILSFLSLFTVKAIQSALMTKSKVQKDIDKTSSLRDALRVMERDINMAFNYQDVFKKTYNDAQKQRQALDATAGANPNPNPMTNPRNANTGANSGSAAVGLPTSYRRPSEYPQKLEDKIRTKFIGEADSVHFTSLSNVRVTENAPISSQAEVGYRLKSCRRRSTQEQASQCLWRRISSYIHEDITKFGEETVLLENVTEFKLRYLGPGKDGEWQESWSTETTGDDVVKGKFPWAVEITIAINDTTATSKDKTLRMTTVAAIRNPNNPPKEALPNGQQPPP